MRERVQLLIIAKGTVKCVFVFVMFVVVAELGKTPEVHTSVALAPAVLAGPNAAATAQFPPALKAANATDVLSEHQPTLKQCAVAAALHNEIIGAGCRCDVHVAPLLN